MQDLHIIGTLTEIFKEQQISDTFKKLDFVIETDEDYPQVLKIELTQDKTGKIAPFKVGDKIKVQYNLRGRKHTKGEKTYFFTTLHAWRISLETEAQVSAPNTSAMPEDNDNADELPF